MDKISQRFGLKKKEEVPLQKKPVVNQDPVVISLHPDFSTGSISQEQMLTLYAEGKRHGNQNA